MTLLNYFMAGVLGTVIAMALFNARLNASIDGSNAVAAIEGPISEV